MAPSPSERPVDASPEEGAGDSASADTAGFRVSLSNFDGPFDLLLNLISKHEMDITEVSLSAVTNEFIAYLGALDDDDDLDQASEFLVVAATLLDMKVAGLLPQGELVDAEAVALLEARDLLFARLLQYRAFKEVSTWFARCLQREDRRHVRAVRLEEKHRRQTPELVWLVAGVTEPGIVVARFISVLELYRHAALSFEQLEPLGELTLRWAADSWSDETLATLGADYDR